GQLVARSPEARGRARELAGLEEGPGWLVPDPPADRRRGWTAPHDLRQVRGRVRKRRWSAACGARYHAIGRGGSGPRLAVALSRGSDPRRSVAGGGCLPAIRGGARAQPEHVAARPCRAEGGSEVTRTILVLVLACLAVECSVLAPQPDRSQTFVL